MTEEKMGPMGKQKKLLLITFAGVAIALVLAMVGYWLGTGIINPQYTDTSTAMTSSSITFASISLGILPALKWLSVLFFIPISFVGMVLRLFSLKKNSEGKGWQWNIKQAIVHSINHFLYHLGLFGTWFIIRVQFIEHSFVLFVSEYDRYSIVEEAQAFIGDSFILFLVYSIAWAVIILYAVNFWDTKRGKLTIKPTVGTTVRLALWNMTIFFAAGIFFSNLLI